MPKAEDWRGVIANLRQLGFADKDVRAAAGAIIDRLIYRLQVSDDDAGIAEVDIAWSMSERIAEGLGIDLAIVQRIIDDCAEAGVLKTTC